MSRWLIVTGVILMTACRILTAPDQRPIMGAVSERGTLIEASAAISDGQVIVRLMTFGNGCYTRGYVDIENRNGRWVLTPYDYVPADAKVNCIDIRRFMEHHATLPHQLLADHVIVRGRNSPGGDVQEFDVPIEL